MGITASVTICDRELTDEQLARLFLTPVGENSTVEDACADRRFEPTLVTRSNGKTMIFDGEAMFAEGFETDKLDLPGRWITGMTVSGTGYFDLRVFDDGVLVRRVGINDDEGLVVAGEPVFDESKFIWPATEEDRKYSDFELTCDGDFLISYLPEAVGLAEPGQDVWSLDCEFFEFDYKAFQAHGLSLDPKVEPATESEPKLEKKGFFERLFGD